MTSETIPSIAKISFWICLAHFYIILSSIIYLKLEGFSDPKNELSKMDMFFTTTFKRQNNLLADSNSLEYSIFKQNFHDVLKNHEYWQQRNKFNDISKVYVYVLGLYTTIGFHDMYLQTWQSKLFFCFTVPFGYVFYFIMLHAIIVEFFEVMAYSAVTIFPANEKKHWNEDERDLYEKLKIVLLTFLIVIFVALAMSLIALLGGRSYLTGLRDTISLILSISLNEEYIDFSHWENHMVAALLTFVVFLVTFSFYLFLYSFFILFRYNTLEDIIHLVFMEENSFQEIISDSDSTNAKKRYASLLYYQGKISSQSMGSESPVIPTEPRVVQTQSYRYSEQTVSSDDYIDEDLHKPSRKKKVKKKSKNEDVPSIHVIEASSDHESEYTNISMKDHRKK